MMNYTMISHSFMYTCNTYIHIYRYSVCFTYKLLYIHIYLHTYNTYSHATTKCVYVKFRQTYAYIFNHIHIYNKHIYHIIIQPHVKSIDRLIEVNVPKKPLPSFWKTPVIRYPPSLLVSWMSRPLHATSRNRRKRWSRLKRRLPRQRPAVEKR